jgi:hypothetical protein
MHEIPEVREIFQEAMQPFLTWHLALAVTHSYEDKGISK